MKTSEDVKTINNVAEILHKLIKDIRIGNLDDIPYGDFTGAIDAIAMNIVSLVRE